MHRPGSAPGRIFGSMSQAPTVPWPLTSNSCHPSSSHSHAVSRYILYSPLLKCVVFDKVVGSDSGRGRTAGIWFFDRSDLRTVGSKNHSKQNNLSLKWRLALNKIEILLVLPENESYQQKVAYSLADSVVLRQNEFCKSHHVITYQRVKSYRR
jgi:hypothetical protein